MAGSSQGLDARPHLYGVEWALNRVDLCCMNILSSMFGPANAGVYRRSIVLYCILGLGVHSAAQSQRTSPDGFVSIFDGKSLHDWDGDTAYWRVQDGALTGEVKPGHQLRHNSFIIWRGGTPADFEMKGEFRISAEGNSGINYRSEQLADIPFALRGYQADIDGQNWYTGQNYEERKRTTLAYSGQKTVVVPCAGLSAPEDIPSKVRNNAWTCVTVSGSLGNIDSLKAMIRPGNWHRFHLVIKGNRLLHYINGVLMSDVTDNDAVNRTTRGLIGVQVHVGPPMMVQYRNLQLKEL
jgi:hypothetical protein